MLKINNKGYALVLVVIIVAVVITLTSTMLFTLNTEIRLNLGTEERERAYYLAQAGIEHGLALIENDEELSPLPSPTDWNFGGTLTYRYRITELTTTSISSTGEILDGTKVMHSVTISATIAANGEVTITSS
jgi:Tfp pilus assembly protein PilX